MPAPKARRNNGHARQKEKGNRGNILARCSLLIIGGFGRTWPRARSEFYLVLVGWCNVGHGAILQRVLVLSFVSNFISNVIAIEEVLSVCYVVSSFGNNWWFGLGLWAKIVSMHGSPSYQSLLVCTTWARDLLVSHYTYPLVHIQV